MRSMEAISFNWWDPIIVLIVYAATLLSSGRVVKKMASIVSAQKYGKIEKETLDTGMIIGKCENIIIITLVMAGDYTALALVFTAKSMVRSKSMTDKPEYYLVGSLVNFTFSILMGFLIKIVCSVLGP